MTQRTPAAGTLRRGAGTLAAAFAALLVAAVALAGCGSSPSPTTLGPTWGRFQATFPSSPRTATGTDERQLAGQFPGSDAVAGYGVSPAKDLFAPNSPVPGPETFGVVVVRYPKSSTVSGQIAALRRALSGAKPVTAGGNRGIRYVGPAKDSPITRGEKVTDASSDVGIEVVGKGDVIFILQAVTTSTSQAESLLGSFKPL